jgi:hypothetical protein
MNEASEALQQLQAQTNQFLASSRERRGGLSENEQKAPLLLGLLGPAGAALGLGGAIFQTARAGEQSRSAQADRESQLAALDASLYGDGADLTELPMGALASQIAARGRLGDDTGLLEQILAHRMDIEKSGTYAQKREAEDLKRAQEAEAREIQERDRLTADINMLSDDAEAYTAPAVSAKRAARIVAEASPDFAGDNALVYAVARANSGAGQLSDTDLAGVAGSGALGAQMQRYFQRLDSGQELLAEDRVALRQQMLRTVQATLDENAAAAGPILEQAKRRGIDPRYIRGADAFQLDPITVDLLSRGLEARPDAPAGISRDAPPAASLVPEFMRTNKKIRSAVEWYEAQQRGEEGGSP